MNAPLTEQRLDALRQYKKLEEKGAVRRPEVRSGDANNHIHTIYSFSPYSPASAAFHAYSAGLETMGIMDHDSLSGAKEFLQACEILGTAATVGFEFRAHFSLPGKSGQRINNPDQSDHAYVAVHGVPHQSIDSLNSFLEKYRAARNVRNRAMTARINERFERYNLSLDFDRDVLPLSMSHEGGSVTERHLMLALGKALTKLLGSGRAVAAFLTDELKLDVSKRSLDSLADENNKFYEYDLLGILKSDTRFFYIPATDESCDVSELVAAAKRAGAIPAYPYLGDVAASVTGDKRAQKFEDDILEEVIEYISGLGFNAVAYMPTRNTAEQLRRLRALCAQKGFFEISGEDINSPRQKFVCEALSNPEFSNLIQSTWALIGHELAATKDIDDGMFTQKTAAKLPELERRIKHFAKLGRELSGR